MEKAELNLLVVLEHHLVDRDRAESPLGEETLKVTVLEVVEDTLAAVLELIGNQILWEAAAAERGILNPLELTQ
jgi:hypothetical protein